MFTEKARLQAVQAGKYASDENHNSAVMLLSIVQLIKIIVECLDQINNLEAIAK